MSEVRVIDSDSLWVRFKRTFSRPAYIIGAVVVALLVATVIAVVVVCTTGGEKEYAVIDYSKALLVSDRLSLWALDLNSREQKKLRESTRGIGPFDLYRRDTIFWYEKGSDWVYSLSLKHRNLTQSRKWEPTSIATDFLTDKVYVLDGYAGKLNVYDMWSTSYGIAVTDLRQPVDIALDPSRGLIFIVQKDDSILKGNMDGTSLEKIITNPSVTSVAVDTQSPRLYWADSRNIKSSDYSGANHLTLVSLSSPTTSLAVSGTRLFWTRAPRDATEYRSLWSCTVSGSGGTNSESDFERIPFEDPERIKIYTGEIPNIRNPCATGNGGCKQLCLLRGGHQTDVGSSCACYMGYRMDEETGNCVLVDEYLLFTRGMFTRGRIFEGDYRRAFAETIPPFAFDQHPSGQGVFSFDYNYYTNRYAASSGSGIRIAELTRTGNASEKSGGYYMTGSNVTSLSVDWVTNDVYYVKHESDDGGLGSVGVIGAQSLGEGEDYSKTLRRFNRSAGLPISLVVHPNKGWYFFTLLQDGRAHIYRVRGTKLAPFLDTQNPSVNETGLAIDYLEDRLYWFNPDARKLVSAHIDGKDFAEVDVSIVQEPRSVVVFGRYAYIANRTSLWRFDKETGYGATRIAPEFEDESSNSTAIDGLRIYGMKVQQLNSDNPCAVRNGDCQQFCSLTPRILVSGPNVVNVTDELQKVCFCADGMDIRSDGKTCVKL